VQESQLSSRSLSWEALYLFIYGESSDFNSHTLGLGLTAWVKVGVSGLGLTEG